MFFLSNIVAVWQSSNYLSRRSTGMLRNPPPRFSWENNTIRITYQEMMRNSFDAALIT
jgi:hypothetical protein